MIKSKIYINSVRFFINFLVVIILHSLGACSGCSPSGRRSHQVTSSTKSYSFNTTENQLNKHKAINNTTNTLKKTLPLNVLYDKYKRSVFLIYTSDGDNAFQGSGFFISKNGLAVSNYHVFEGTSQGLEVIETYNGQNFRIKEVLDKDKENDFIIFRVDIGNYMISNPIPVASQSPDIGDDVFAIGNPRGLESTLSKGIVSSYRENNCLIQTTTEITHGSSGGPLLNMKGEVVGITTGGFGEANLNFAVNISLLNLYRFF